MLDFSTIQLRRRCCNRCAARFAYNWTDGTPRVVPIWFHRNGSEIVLGLLDIAPKVNALRDGDAVALTIDSDTMPYKVLLIRGTVHMDVVEGIAPEHEAAAICVLRRGRGTGLGGAAKADLGRGQHAVFIKPTWVGVMDFETRFPNAGGNVDGGGRGTLIDRSARWWRGDRQTVRWATYCVDASTDR